MFSSFDLIDACRFASWNKTNQIGPKIDNGKKVHKPLPVAG